MTGENLTPLPEELMRLFGVDKEYLARWDELAAEWGDEPCANMALPSAAVKRFDSVLRHPAGPQHFFTLVPGGHVHVLLIDGPCNYPIGHNVGLMTERRAAEDHAMMLRRVEGHRHVHCSDRFREMLARHAITPEEADRLANGGSDTPPPVWADD
jgi:hypothetical protein